MGSVVDMGNGPVGTQGPGGLESSEMVPGAAPRGIPVAQEIPVSVTGTRPGEGPTKRELFSEETITVLLFPDGALIRLAAAVATGQLIFLTNKNTRKEVVCQVVGKRSFRPTSCYVELQFTEAIREFWGVEFPAGAAETVASPKPAAKAVEGKESEKKEEPAAEVRGKQTAETCEAVAAVEDIEYVLEEPAPQPSVKEVANLREEVEALREQLKALKQSEAAASAAAARSSVVEAPKELPTETAKAAAREPAKVEDEAADQGAVKKEESKTAANPEAAVPWPKEWPKENHETEKVAERKPATAAVGERSSHLPMALPLRARDYRELPKKELPGKDPEEELLDELLPKPALDFSNIPVVVEQPGYQAPGLPIGKGAFAAMALVLVGGLGLGAWKLGLLPQWTVGKPAPLVLTRAVAAAKTPANKDSTAAAEATKPDGEKGPASSAGAATDAKSAGTGAVNSGEKRSEEPSAVVAGSAAPAVAGKTGGGTESFVSRLFGKKKKLEATEETAAPPAEVLPTPSEEVPVLPAKLLKTAAPVYPPDAMRSFITGDVTLEAEVDENGKLRNIEALSGPAALRGAAVDALKQYQYAAATRGGKSVASEVKVTIKFWFAP